MGWAIVQRQMRVVEGDRREVVEVALLQRLEPDARPLERDGRDPGLGGSWHASDGSRRGGLRRS